MARGRAKSQHVIEREESVRKLYEAEPDIKVSVAAEKLGIKESAVNTDKRNLGITKSQDKPKKQVAPKHQQPVLPSSDLTTYGGSVGISEEQRSKLKEAMTLANGRSELVAILELVSAGGGIEAFNQICEQRKLTLEFFDEE